MTNEEIIQELSGKTVLEINELVKALEEAWGVSAAAIRELNNLGDNDQLKPGQVIKLPADAQQ